MPVSVLRALANGILHACITALPVTALAVDDQWYVGVGGGASILAPDVLDSSQGVDDSLGQVVTAYVGRDLDSRTSVQGSGFSLGIAEFDNGDDASYYGFDAGILYRFYDLRDRQLRPGNFSANLYGRFALGFLDRTSDTGLVTDSTVYFGGGVGAEMRFTKNIGVRAEAFYHDTDAASAMLSLVTRFGGPSARRGASPPPVLERDAPPVSLPPLATPEALEVPGEAVSLESLESAEPESLPTQDSDTLPEVYRGPVDAAPQATPSNAERGEVVDLSRLGTETDTGTDDGLGENAVTDTDADGDEDGVADSTDECPVSTPGFPVNAEGCALFNGVLLGVTFADGSAEIGDAAIAQLDILARLMQEYLQARVELHAHASASGVGRADSVLTRDRLRSVGTYLVDRGVRSRRLVLRSFGSNRPLREAAVTAEGASNDRLEIFEHTE